jgi:hypothetical protein
MSKLKGWSIFLLFCFVHTVGGIWATAGLSAILLILYLEYGWLVERYNREEKAG